MLAFTESRRTIAHDKGTVRHFDLRNPHVCSHHTVRSFLLASHRPARSYPNANIPSDAPEGCPNPLLNYYPYDIDLNTITLNKLNPQYFAVAGMDTYIYLHDRRMIGSGGGGAGRAPNFAKMSRCIRKFATSNSSGPRGAKHVTACKFSEANGQELIGSWSSDAVYLFNMNDAPIRRTRIKGYKSSSKRKRSTRESSEIREQNLSDMKEIIATLNGGDIDETIVKTNTFIENQHMNTIANWTARLYHNDQNKEEILIRKVWGFGIEAASRKVRAATFDQGENTKSDDSEALRDMMLAEHIAPKTWRGAWCLAVAFWIAGHNNAEKDLDQTLEWVQKARSLASQALELYSASIAERPVTSPSSSSQVGSGVESEAEKYRNLEDEFSFSSPVNMIEGFQKDMKKAEELVEQLVEQDQDSRSSGENMPLPLTERLDSAIVFPWLDYMYISSPSGVDSDDMSSSPNVSNDPKMSPGEGTSVDTVPLQNLGAPDDQEIDLGKSAYQQVPKLDMDSNDYTASDKSVFGSASNASVNALSSSSKQRAKASSEPLDEPDALDEDIDMEGDVLKSSDLSMSENLAETGGGSNLDDSNDDLETSMHNLSDIGSSDDLDADSETALHGIEGSENDLVSDEDHDDEEEVDDDDDDDDDNDDDDETDSDDENDSDDEWLRIRSSTNKDRSHLEHDVDVIGHRTKYMGHCNKRVCFSNNDNLALVTPI